MSVYYDGTFTTALAIGVSVPEYPEPANSAVVIYRQPFMVLRANYSRMANGTAGPGTSILVEENNFADVGGGLITFDRVWATVPSDWSEYQPYTHLYQTVDVLGSVSYLAEVSQTLSSRILHEYESSTTMPFTPLKAYRFLQIFSSGSVYTIGIDPGAASEIVAEDSIVERWMGDIWRMSTRYVEAKSFTDFYIPA